MSARAEYHQEVLRQAGVALQGREVTLWEVMPTAAVAPMASSISILPDHATRADLDATLRHWGAPVVEGSRWIGCRLEDGKGWCVAPVRTRPPAPPPGGVERRSRERLILELAGLCLGAIDVTVGPKPRLSPSEAAWEYARQPSVIAHEVGNQLTVAGGNLEFGLASVRAAESLDPGLRAQLMEDLTNAAKGIGQTTSPFEYAARLTEFTLLGNLAQHAGAGKKVEWDGPNMQATNLPELNAWVKREYREGWRV